MQSKSNYTKITYMTTMVLIRNFINTGIYDLQRIGCMKYELTVVPRLTLAQSGSSTDAMTVTGVGARGTYV